MSPTLLLLLEIPEAKNENIFKLIDIILIIITNFIKLIKHINK